MSFFLIKRNPFLYSHYHEHTTYIFDTLRQFVRGCLDKNRQVILDILLIFCEFFLLFWFNSEHANMKSHRI